ncbi:hypothetical protein FQ775_23960 [Nitratireductor mangrovi]|uniref:Uncharacterized protein n=1 Tax=Nitratireductor mangrovi TaxID=2599600 RepID=A0A6H0DXY3_9HYPH|nr:hypothetical protein [Nitratireductor mangrovi]QIS94658.1 hypothetical protein FQ775_23960 [Nitratireductor mangrovi]
MDEQKLLSQIFRIFPFDTGAFFSGRYNNFFDRESKIDDFELPPSIDYVRKYIGALYQGNYEYITGSSRKNVNISIDNFEAAGLYELAREPANPTSASRTPADERASAIEIQMNQPIKIKGCLTGIVVPERFFDVEKWVKSIERWNPKYIEKYSIINTAQPEFFAGQVYMAVIKILKESGHLK